MCLEAGKPALGYPQIKRKMSLHDSLYQKQKSGSEEDPQRFKQVKYEVDCMVRTSYNNCMYIDSLVGTVDDSLSSNNSRPNNNKRSIRPWIA